jgi:23S rRNA (uracil1939-C5)-methyltransferase/tRNA (uracil-5-)-methyltransferase
MLGDSVCQDGFTKLRDSVIVAASTSAVTTRDDPAHDLSRPCLIRSSAHGLHTEDDDTSLQKINSLSFHHHAGSFFQVNNGATALLVDYVKSQTLENRVIDTFCGVGLFSLSLGAVEGKVVYGTEIDPVAIEFAKRNSVLNKVDQHSTFRAKDAGETFADLPEIFRDGEGVCVIADPPRAGLQPQYVANLLAYAPSRFIYVSCDPGTQARDAALILKSGKYELLVVQPFDLFPQTRHVESVAVFVRT